MLRLGKLRSALPSSTLFTADPLPLGQCFKTLHTIAKITKSFQSDFSNIAKIANIANVSQN
jgi:hypothetical protein